jgi:hypothetical protein
MTCSRCKHEFCWLCDADYKGIRRVGNTAHRETCRFHSANLSSLGPEELGEEFEAEHGAGEDLPRGGQQDRQYDYLPRRNPGGMTPAIAVQTDSNDNNQGGGACFQETVSLQVERDLKIFPSRHMRSFMPGVKLIKSRHTGGQQRRAGIHMRQVTAGIKTNVTERRVTERGAKKRD